MIRQKYKLIRDWQRTSRWRLTHRFHANSLTANALSVTLESATAFAISIAVKQPVAAAGTAPNESDTTRHSAVHSGA